MTLSDNMSNPNRSRPVSPNRNIIRTSPRWWQFRRSSRAVQNAPAVQEDQSDEEDWISKIASCFRQVSAAAGLPALSPSSRKAIFCVIGLVLLWKFIIWALQLIVTGVCFLVAVSIVVTFLKPDLSIWFLTAVLPPYMVAVKAWLAEIFLDAGHSLRGRPPPPLPPLVPGTPRSPRTITSPAPFSTEPILVETNA